MVNALQDNRQITVIGLGNMGSAIAERLLATGHTVSVWNRSKSKCAPLVSMGATSEETPAAAINTSSLILICVLDVKAVEAILASDGVGMR